MGASKVQARQLAICPDRLHNISCSHRLTQNPGANMVDDQLKTFGNIARGLARNPLGIIALFIVLVYGFAALVTTFTGSFSEAERLPLIYFLVVFPLVVLGVFAWLVSKHSVNLFSPSDFRDEKNYVEMVSSRTLAAVASLTLATARGAESVPDAAEIGRIVESVQRSPILYENRTAVRFNRNVLWVDDNPDNNTRERQAFKEAGVMFTLAQSTQEALEYLASRKFAAIISDIGRREGPREGYVLLDSLRQRGDQTPLFFYAGSNDPAHKRETAAHGGQGCTNNARELFDMVMDVITERYLADIPS
jgi:CheY-like chemotaxis protein